MKAVGIRELKAKLSEYVRQARSGEVILVTDRGEVVAEMRTTRYALQDAEAATALEALARGGLVTLGAPNEPGSYPDLAPLAGQGQSARLIDEERGE